MPRYFLDLAFNGSQFNGWQKQKNASGVQQTIEEGISAILRNTTEIIGAGRTDTGVHARKMIAHFDSQEPIADPEKFVFQLDGYVGREIHIRSLHMVNGEAHARFDALSRTYRYHLLQQKDPFIKDLAYYHPKELDFTVMNRACEHLLGKKDFTSFSRSNTQTKTNLCTIESAQWTKDSDQWIFEIKADRFLRNMVRAIVGTLLEIGEGKRAEAELKQIIEMKDRKVAGASAPAHGLYLVEIDYPKSIYR